MTKAQQEKAMRERELKGIQGMLDLAKTRKPTKIAREAACLAHVFVLEFTTYMLDPKLKGQQHYMDALGLLIERAMKPSRKRKLRRN